jgi:hypothetical protein
MWVLIVVFAHLSARDGVTTSVTTQEFTSRQTCQAGREIVLAALKADTERTREVIQNGIGSGTISGPQALTLKAECTRK